MARHRKAEPDDIEPGLREAFAEAWFAGYSAGNLDGYFGTHDERKVSPYADLDPYRGA